MKKTIISILLLVLSSMFADEEVNFTPYEFYHFDIGVGCLFVDAGFGYRKITSLKTSHDTAFF